MDLYYTESFGPTVALFTFKTEDEAIAVANDTEYGLSSAIFTENLAAGLRVAKQIETGYVFPCFPSLGVLELRWYWLIGICIAL